MKRLTLAQMKCKLVLACVMRYLMWSTLPNMVLVFMAVTTPNATTVTCCLALVLLSLILSMLYIRARLIELTDATTYLETMEHQPVYVFVDWHIRCFLIDMVHCGGQADVIRILNKRFPVMCIPQILKRESIHLVDFIYSLVCPTRIYK